MEISVIIPVYNEKENIEPMVKKINETLEKKFKYYEILYVNDGSTDGTEEELKRLIADEGKVLQNTKTGKTAYCVDVFAENVDLWKEIL